MDENDRLYFYEEHGKESCWELPEISDTEESDDECGMTDVIRSETSPATSPAHTPSTKASFSDDEWLDPTERHEGDKQETQSRSEVSISKPSTLPLSSSFSTVTATIVQVNRSAPKQISGAKAQFVPIPNIESPSSSRSAGGSTFTVGSLKLKDSSSSATPPTSSLMNTYSERVHKSRSMAVLVSGKKPSNPTIPESLLREAANAMIPRIVGDDDSTSPSPRETRDIPSPPSSLQDCVKIIKQGTLTRTKLLEGGKRQRKNWANNYIVLTEYYLVFFKDEKSAKAVSSTLS